MKRQEKENEVGSLVERFKSAEFAVLADYRGMNAAQMTHLRRAVREGKGQMKVVKNTLARLAVQDTELKLLQDHFVGTIAAITAHTDPVSPAKALVKFAKEVEQFKLKIGFLSGKLLNVAEIENLSKLPSKEQLLASMLGSMQAPATNLVGVLAAIPRKLVCALAAIRDKKES
ncbi:MAG: 50S ribosomal protein L10 [Deltaproteobacteria bacterium]|nr:50S ribosomal protein L10 [Deltaproteobacteria bacterium]